MILRIRAIPDCDVEAECLAPDHLLGLSRHDVASLTLQCGRYCLRLDHFFDIEDDGSEAVSIYGDLSRFKYVGRGMSSGSLIVYGSVGSHAFAHMRGGWVTIRGDAGDWLAAEMANGIIDVLGNAGHHLGSAYRGASLGMTGGRVVVSGSAGRELGMRMRRGTIVVGGQVGSDAGVEMSGGTLVLLSGAADRVASGMTRGTIISLKPLELLPTFHSATVYLPSFVNLYSQSLRSHGVNLPTRGGAYHRYTGDSSGLGKGEILIWQPAT